MCCCRLERQAWGCQSMSGRQRPCSSCQRCSGGRARRAIFRQNRAKGPNPLSVQKKKRSQPDAAGTDHAETGSKPKRKRSRKKAKGDGDGEE